MKMMTMVMKVMMMMMMMGMADSLGCWEKGVKIAQPKVTFLNV